MDSLLSFTKEGKCLEFSLASNLVRAAKDGRLTTSTSLYQSKNCLKWDWESCNSLLTWFQGKCDSFALVAEWRHLQVQSQSGCVPFLFHGTDSKQRLRKVKIAEEKQETDFLHGLS